MRFQTECDNCRYSREVASDVDDEGIILKCYRYPPVIFVIDGEVVQAVPDASDWCGEWSA